MDYEIGSIVFIKKVIFKTSIKNQKVEFYCEVDHARSRPAIIIAEDSDYTYFLHITSKEFYEKNNQYYIGPISKNNIGGYICLESVQKRNLCYRDEITKIDDEQLLKILRKFCEYQENIRMDEEYPKIKQLIYNTINELSNIKTKIKKK